MAYERVGEFDRAQFILAFVNCVARNANSYFSHIFAYLVLEQRFVCLQSGKYTPCTTEYICQAPANSITYKVDEKYEYYIDNWFL